MRVFQSQYKGYMCVQKLLCVSFSLSTRDTHMCRNSYACVSASVQGITCMCKNSYVCVSVLAQGYAGVQKLLCVCVSLSTRGTRVCRNSDVCFSLFYGVVLLTALVMGGLERKQMALKNHVSSCKRKSKPGSLEACGFWKLHDLKMLSYTCLTLPHCPQRRHHGSQPSNVEGDTQKFRS